MYILPVIDELKTKKSGMAFFKNNLPRIENIAGTSLGKSLDFNGVKHSSNVNTVEKMATSRMEARAQLKYIWKSIGELTDREGDVIIMRYINELMWAKIASELHCSEVAGHSLLNKAIVHFAEKTNDEFGLVVYK